MKIEDVRPIFHLRADRLAEEYELWFHLRAASTVYGIKTMRTQRTMELWRFSDKHVGHSGTLNVS